MRVYTTKAKHLTFYSGDLGERTVARLALQLKDVFEFTDDQVVEVEKLLSSRVFSASAFTPAEADMLEELLEWVCFPQASSGRAFTCINLNSGRSLTLFQIGRERTGTTLSLNRSVGTHR